MVRSAVSGSQDGDCVYKYWSTEADLSRQSRRSRREGSCCSRPCNVHEAAAGWRPRDRRSLRGLLATSIPDSGRTPATAISLRSSNVMRFHVLCWPVCSCPPIDWLRGPCSHCMPTRGPRGGMLSASVSDLSDPAAHAILALQSSGATQDLLRRVGFAVGCFCTALSL